MQLSTVTVGKARSCLECKIKITVNMASGYLHRHTQDYILHIKGCVCVCVCVSVREREMDM